MKIKRFSFCEIIKFLSLMPTGSKQPSSDSDVTETTSAESPADQNKQQLETKEEKGKKGSKKNRIGKADMMFMVAAVILLGISGPYLYYTFVTYNYIQENSKTKAGPNFIPPSLSDLWITAISAVSIFVMKMVILKGCPPAIRAVLRPAP